MIKKSAWYRPQADVAAFYPATPNSELIKRIRKVIEKEASRLDMKVRVVEKGGNSWKTKLVKSEIRRNSERGAPDCYLDAGGQSRGYHHRAGALYEATCQLCKQTNTNASYIGESGDSAYTRCLKHLEAVRKDDPKNSALAMHLREYRPTQVRHEESFKLKVLRTFKKPMERQVAETVVINNSKADIIMNRKEEWVAPVTVRLQPL